MSRWRGAFRSCQAEAVQGVSRQSDARALQDSLRERGEQGATAVERVLSGPRELGREGLGPEGIARQARALRFVPARLAASALFLAGGAAAGATWGPGAAGMVVLAAVLAPRHRISAVAAEAGAMLGWYSFHSSTPRWTLVVVGVLGLSLLVTARTVRGRAPLTEPRSWGLGVGLAALGALEAVPLPQVGAAARWLVLSGWVLAVLLALFTEGFTPIGALRRWHPPPSVRERVFGRGSVSRNVIAAAVATSADFLVFRLLLDWLSPALATLFGCAIGGLLNFTLNQRWAFDTSRPLPAAAMRYVWVSAASAAFNSAAVAVALLDPTVSPVMAWGVVRALGFLGWNYPMQRDHVFAHGRSR